MSSEETRPHCTAAGITADANAGLLVRSEIFNADGLTQPNRHSWCPEDDS